MRPKNWFRLSLSSEVLNPEPSSRPRGSRVDQLLHAHNVALLDYAPLMKVTIDKNMQFALLPFREGKLAKEWNEVLARCQSIKAQSKPERKLELATDLATRLSKMAGRFPKDLLADLQPLVEQGDAARVQALVDAAHERPAKWLRAEHLGW